MTFLAAQLRYLSEKISECGITNIQDEADFQKRVLKNSVPVLVDFHATWCAPCKLLGPRLESVMQSHMNSVLLAKVDIDKNDDLAAKYRVIFFFVETILWKVELSTFNTVCVGNQLDQARTMLNFKTFTDICLALDW
ncbi:unnamed protein product [Echinostoma caproni]|uniref:Thioredoxin domain-containing protein n=1 Tax=Echinostoma caproni TaxID=27848 RepID=A0A183B191_9TREM|nr:unnamed protein product [Echinostoma caproni]